MDPKLLVYLENTLKPIYQSFDKAHQIDHIDKVIEHSMEIAKNYSVRLDMVITIAYYHDIGLQFGRENHHLTGGLFLYNDANLRTFFNEEDMKTMKEAVEDHRASRHEVPRSIYGMIIAEADRDINLHQIVLRTVQYGLKRYPKITKNEHIERVFKHIMEKYGPEGYLKLWIQTSKNQEGLNEIRAMLRDENQFKAFISCFYDDELNKC